MKLFKHRKNVSLRDALAEYVEKNYGKEYVADALYSYDTLNKGGTIGGFNETAAFLDMISKVRK